MKTYISVNIVSQALILSNALKQHNCERTTELPLLKLPYGVNRDSALQFLVQCKWVTISDCYIAFTPFGNSTTQRFAGVIIDQGLWRVILSQYISCCEPAWASRIPYGRKEAYLSMGIEEQRCFDESGLMESTDTDVIDWWDSLAEIERTKHNTLLLDVGREGERLTIEYERNRGANPLWYSLDSNLAGYDILSQQVTAPDRSILIEVKASSKSLTSATCVITRNEWETAQRKNNVNRYYFYLWHLNSGQKKLAIIDVTAMKKHVPTDAHNGRWESVSIPFYSFKDMFHTPIMN